MEEEKLSPFSKILAAILVAIVVMVLLVLVYKVYKARQLVFFSHTEQSSD